MKVDSLTQQVYQMQKRLSGLSQHACTSIQLQPELLLEAFKDIGTLLETLQLTQKQLQQQSEKLEQAQTTLATEHQRSLELFELSEPLHTCCFEGKEFGDRDRAGLFELSVSRDESSCCVEACPVSELCLPTLSLWANSLSNDANMIVSITGVIQRTSCTAIALLNASEQFLIGRPFLSLVAPAERKNLYAQLLKMQFSTQSQQWQVQLCPPQAEPFLALIVAAVVHDCEAQAVGLHLCIRKGGYTPTPVEIEIDRDKFTTNFPQHVYLKGEIIPLHPQSIWLVLQGVFASHIRSLLLFAQQRG